MSNIASVWHNAANCGQKPQARILMYWSWRTPIPRTLAHDVWRFGYFSDWWVAWSTKPIITQHKFDSIGYRSIIIKSQIEEAITSLYRLSIDWWIWKTIWNIWWTTTVFFMYSPMCPSAFCTAKWLLMRRVWNDSFQKMKQKSWWPQRWLKWVLMCPNASVIVIESAERWATPAPPVARSRGSGAKQSYCVFWWRAISWARWF